MASPVEKIDAQIRKLEKVREIVADAELVALLRAYIFEPQDESSALPRTDPAQMAEMRRVREAGGALTEGHRERAKGALTEAVRAAAMKQHGGFTGDQLAEIMERDGFVFNTASPATAVMDVLRKFERQHLVTVFPGKGSTPSRFFNRNAVASVEPGGAPKNLPAQEPAM